MAMTAPSEAADVAWMNNTLKSRAPRIAVHDVAVPPVDDDSDDTSASALKIDSGVLDRL
jgi:hypothetical protein